MKIILAFDSYKGSLSAPEACAAAGEGLGRLSPAPEIVQCPLSDGGEGFAEAMRLAGGGDVRTVEVTGPLFEKRQAAIVLLDGGKTAVVESAMACGLELVPPGQRSPLRTTSYGLGEMLLAAAEMGAERIVVGLGGSATNDGGMGMLNALGWRFLDADGHLLPPIGSSLDYVWEIEPGQTLPGVQIIAACDVDNPLAGPHGAAYTYAPQKGATPEDVAVLDRGLARYARVSKSVLGEDFSSHPGAGAAGGLGFALLAFLHAQFRPGASLAIELSRLEEHLTGATLCFTGEGRTDAQTAHGKLPAAVAACCARAGVPCVCLSGSLGEGWRALYDQGMTAVFSITQRPTDLTTAIAEAGGALADCAEAIGRIAEWGIRDGAPL
ncbi:MAG: glycerate kinase family protein [Armatimonadota bacterium]